MLPDTPEQHAILFPRLSEGQLSELRGRGILSRSELCPAH